MSSDLIGGADGVYFQYRNAFSTVSLFLKKKIEQLQLQLKWQLPAVDLELTSKLRCELYVDFSD